MRRVAVLLPALLACLALPRAADAQVRTIEILAREPMPARTGDPGPAYELLRGRAHGEVDPKDPKNAIIQDVALAPVNARGHVEYVATFALAKPVDMRRASGVLVYTVVNRGNGGATASADGHVSLVSGWQGDVVPTANNQTIAVPIARQRTGASIGGPVIARFVNVPPGTNTMPIRLSSMGASPPPYPPADLAEPDATLLSAATETPAGVKTGVVHLPRSAWAFADCRTTPFPGTPDPARLCVKDGFDPARLYELVYTAKDPLVLGLGLAATRDIVSFFRYAAQDAAGTANPIAGAIGHAVGIGDSQSGNFIKSAIHLGFNQDLSGRLVWDGVFPRIAARQTPINFRFALPGGAALLYEPGSDGVLWWSRYADTTRGRATASLLDRCTATHTCPKVIEAFGSSEFWGLRMSPGLVGTDARTDIPLPDTVRRYYYPGTTHGGGRGGFRVEAGPAQGACALPANPNPEADTTRALTVALIEWVVNGTPPPASRYPRLSAHELVDTAAWRSQFPALAGLTLGEQLLNPVLQYDFGASFAANDLSGVLSRMPPRIVRAIPTLVPAVNGDGNETSGVSSVLAQAPLGTYLGWNVTANGFFKGQGCGYAGGYLPFARTRAERDAAHDPRPSVEERYGTLEGYVCTVRRAADAAVRDRFLLRTDADRLIAEASASAVLPRDATSASESQAIGRMACGGG